MAIPGLWGVDPLEAARWENALFFGGNVILTALAAWRASAGSRVAAVAAAALMLVSVDQLYVHSMAWTEPSFIFFTLAAMLFLAGFLQHGDRRYLFACAVASALAVLDRYAGVAVVLAAAASIVLWDRSRMRARVVVGAGLAVATGAPLALWMLRNQAFAGTATSRTLTPNTLLPSQIPLAMDAASGWLLPLNVPVEYRTLALLAVAVSCVALWWRSSPERAPDPGAGHASGVIVLYSVVYLVVMAASITIIDPPPVPVDFRLMSPLYPPAVILAVSAALTARRAGTKSDLARATAVVGFAVLIVVGLGRALPWLGERHSDGLGYASQAWRQSQVMNLVRALPPGARLYSNASDAIYALTGRPGFPLPPVSSFETGLPNAGFLDQIDIVRSGMAANGGYIVYCRAASWRTNLPGESALVELLGLQAVVEASDGVIYRLAP